MMPALAALNPWQGSAWTDLGVWVRILQVPGHVGTGRCAIGTAPMGLSAVLTLAFLIPHCVQSGAIWLTIMLFMAVTSTGSAELIAVSSLFSYDIYR